MNAWLNANADGIALMLIFGLIGTIVLLILLVAEKVHQTRRFRIDGCDESRCERTGSMNEFSRRLRARGL